MAGLLLAEEQQDGWWAYSWLSLHGCRVSHLCANATCPFLRYIKPSLMDTCKVKMQRTRRHWGINLAWILKLTEQSPYNRYNHAIQEHFDWLSGGRSCTWVMTVCTDPARNKPGSGIWGNSWSFYVLRKKIVWTKINNMQRVLTFACAGQARTRRMLSFHLMFRTSLLRKSACSTAMAQACLAQLAHPESLCLLAPPDDEDA